MSTLTTIPRPAHNHSGDRPGFSHEAFYYSGMDEFVSGIAGFLQEASAARTPTLVVVPSPKIDRLRTILDDTSDQVSYADMTEVGLNPASVIPVWADFVAAHPGRSLRGVGEPVWPGRSASALDECHVHEALINRAFADEVDFWLRCPYDMATLDPHTLTTSTTTHPLLTTQDVPTPNPDFTPDYQAAALPPAPPWGTYELDFNADDLEQIRHVTAVFARRTGLSADRVDDVVLAVSEVAANSVVHAGGHGTLRIWTSPPELLCAVTDSGYITDPLVGRVRPSPQALGGRGLWMANSLADLVQIRTTPNQGNEVRLHFTTTQI